MKREIIRIGDSHKRNCGNSLSQVHLYMYVYVYTFPIYSSVFLTENVENAIIDGSRVERTRIDSTNSNSYLLYKPENCNLAE